MAKIVRYNGGTLSYYPCSKPFNLVKGKQYEVVSEDVRDRQTNYTLKGVNGKFNSCWFDEIQKNSIFLAIAHHKPTISSRCECCKIEVERGRPVLIPWSTSPVREISDMGNNIYRVVTQNNTYIIQVG